MTRVTLITGNQDKADNIAKYLGLPLDHQKVDLDELQSLDLEYIVTHKARQAFEIIQKPALVEDICLEFSAFGRLPGPFIRYFVDEVPLETICRMLDGFERTAVARCTFGYCDGGDPVLFSGTLMGTIAEHPAGANGFGWDGIFIPEGYSTTRAELDAADYEAVYRKLRPFDALKQFLETR